MKRYLYILIVLSIFLCVCLFCKGCIDIYENFSVGGDNNSGINISQKLILSSSGSGFDCKKPDPKPNPPSKEGEPPFKPDDNDYPNKIGDCCNASNEFDGTNTLIEGDGIKTSITCDYAFKKGYISSVNNTGDVNTKNAKKNSNPEGYVVKWPGYKGYFRQPIHDINKCYTLNTNTEMSSEKFRKKYTFTQPDETKVDVPTISLSDDTKTNYLYAGDQTMQIMNPTYPGGLCYQKKEDKGFNENTCMGGHPLFPKVSKCIPIDDITEDHKTNSVINLKDWTKVNIEELKRIWDTDDNYKLGICEPFEDDHIHADCGRDKKQTYLSDCSEIYKKGYDECETGCVKSPMETFAFATKNNDNTVSGYSTIIDAPNMLKLVPVDKRKLKINIKRTDQIPKDKANSIHNIVYVSIWLSTACADTQTLENKSKDDDCPGCYDGCDRVFGGNAGLSDSKDGITPGDSGWNKFPSDLTNIPLNNNDESVITIPNKYIGYEKSTNYNSVDDKGKENKAIMASGGRILFHTLPISQDDQIIDRIKSLDHYDQIEFTIQYRTNLSGSGIVKFARMVTNFSAVDSLKSIYLNVDDKVSGKSMINISCKPTLDVDLNTICTKFYSRNADRDFIPVIQEIIELYSKWYDPDMIDNTVNIDSKQNKLIDLEVENCNKNGECTTGSFKRISDKCLSIKNMSDFGNLQKIYNNLSEENKNKIDPTKKGNIDNLLEQLGYFKEIRRYYKYCIAHDDDSDKTLYYYFGPASMLLLMGIYAGDSNNTTYNKIVMNIDDVKKNAFKTLLPNLDELKYFDDTVPNIQSIANKFYDMLSDDQNSNYLFPTIEILGDIKKKDGSSMSIQDLENYVKVKVLCVVMNYTMLSKTSNLNTEYGRVTENPMINSMAHTISPYLNSMIQRGYGDLINIPKNKYKDIVIDGRTVVPPTESEKWTRSFKVESEPITSSKNYCKGVTDNRIDKSTVIDLHNGSDDFFYNDWIDLVLGKNTLIVDGTNLGKSWGDECLQYPISYGDACDPNSTSVITNYTDEVDITFGLYN